jgi:hypothetical protein
MALPSTAPSARVRLPRVEPGTWRRPEALVAAGIAVVALALAAGSHAHHGHALLHLAPALVASLALFALSGYPIACTLVPASWGALRPLLSLPLGMASSGLALTALGLARVPLKVSELLVLAGGIVATVVVSRRRDPRRERARPDRLQLGAWMVVLAVLLLVALIPAWRLAADTIYGENPDAHQVAGVAVLFQHDPPTATDVALPIDTVPAAWRFRYPIFYGLAAASNLSHQDPIRVFPAIAALLMVATALGFAAIAIRCLGLPPAAGMAVAAVLGLWSILLHLGWHPYWNQLWGLMLLPYAVLFGWRALADRDGRMAVLFALMLVTLWLAYPLALPYPLIIVGALAVAYWRPLELSKLRSRGWLAGVIALVVLAPAVVGAAVKLEQGVSQLVTPSSSLWGGDVKTLMPIGQFVGTGGGIAAVVVVLALAVLGLQALPRRPRLALGIALAALCLLDLRFRLASSGAYMDFKHLTFVGAFVLTLAATAVCRLVLSRTRLAVGAGVALSVCWIAAALVRDHREAIDTGPQVTEEMFDVRSWADRLPVGASVRVDIPPSGVQLWAVYMLGSHPVDTPDPVLGTTYAHAPVGSRADYSLSLAFAPGTSHPFPAPQFAENPPLARNAQFVLRKVAWPKRLAAEPETASTRLVP